MRESNTHATKKESNIHCVEVLISKRYLSNSNNNMLWTLSVYSLQNQPVKKNRAIHNSEIFHFMVYDWKRTIKQLLEENQVPYSITQFFSLDNIYSGKVIEEMVSPDNEVDFLTALHRVPDSGGVSQNPLLHSAPEKQRREEADLLHH